MPSIANLATTVALNAKINEVKGEIPNITNLATITALTADVSNLIKKLTITQKLVNLKITLLILIMINILLLQNLMSKQQNILQPDLNKKIQQAEVILLIIF